MKPQVSLFQSLVACSMLAACGVSRAATTPLSMIEVADVAPQSQVSAQPNVNEVKSFVHYWFSLFDRRVDVNKVTALLSSDVHADFLGQVYPSREAFAAMYKVSMAALVSADHEVEKIQVTTQPGGAAVQTWIHFRSTDKLGQQVDMKVHQTWRLVWLGGTNFQVAEYVVRPALDNKQLQRRQYRAQAVLYRWFYFYESTQPNFDEQYAILTDDLSIQGSTSIKSLAEYKDSLAKPYFVFGQNAHHVQNVTFESITPEAMLLKVSIIYQAIDKGGAIRSSRLNYVIQMVETVASLPKIKTITITPIAEAEKIFVASYSENRAKAEAFEQRAKAQ